MKFLGHQSRDCCFANTMEAKKKKKESPGYFGLTEREMEFPQPQEVSRTQFYMKKGKQEKPPLGRRMPSSNVAIGSGGCLRAELGQPYTHSSKPAYTQDL